MKKIRKILLPIASVIGMTTCIAPMAACNTTATTVARTTAATTKVSTNSDVKFTPLYDTIRTSLYQNSYDSGLERSLTYDRDTDPVAEAHHEGWDEPRFDDKNQLWFRNSERSGEFRLITEQVRVDITVPAHTTMKTEVGIDTFVTIAVNGTPGFYGESADVCTEIFTLDDAWDHPNVFINWASIPYDHNVIRSWLHPQKEAEAKRRVGGRNGFQHAQLWTGKGPHWHETHANAEWHDKKVIYQDNNFSDFPQTFTHYLQVSANTFGRDRYDPWETFWAGREATYRFAFSAHEVQ